MGGMSDGKPNIYQRMLAVMRAISYVQKSDKTVNGQYRFVTHDAVTALVRSQLVEQGIVALTDVTAHTQDGNRTEVDVRVSFVSVDDPQDRVVVNAFGYGIDPQDKGPGKAISYAVKYAYLKAFALETGDDPECDNIDHKPLPRAIPANVEGADLWNALDTGTRDMLSEIAQSAIALTEEGRDAHAYLESHGFDHETKLALWTQLPAPTRRKIKEQAKRAT